MSGTIKVSADDVQATATQLANGHQTLLDTHNTLTGHVQGLMANGWQSSAGTAFNDAWDKYNSGAQQMFDALGTIHQGLTNTSNVYRETEGKLTQGWTV